MGKVYVGLGAEYTVSFTEQEMIEVETAAKATGHTVESFIKDASLKTARQLNGIPRVTIKGVKRKE